MNSTSGTHLQVSLCANPTTTATINEPRLRTMNVNATAGAEAVL